MLLGRVDDGGGGGGEGSDQSQKPNYQTPAAIHFVCMWEVYTDVSKPRYHQVLIESAKN